MSSGRRNYVERSVASDGDRYLIDASSETTNALTNGARSTFIAGFREVVEWPQLRVDGYECSS